MKLSREEAAQHLLNRRRARRSLIDFASYIAVPGRPYKDDPDCELFHPVETNLALHHRVMLQALQETIETPGGRLMIFMPRGAAKSTYASVVAPAWCMGRSPRARIIQTSYRSDLARRMGRRTRSVIQQPRYGQIFNTRLRADSKAADDFILENNAEYIAVGLEAGVVGTRAEGIIIDDPVSGREAAESQIQRDSNWDAFKDNLSLCLVPHGWMVIVQTRWNQDDLAGRILPENWAGESGVFECRDGKTWRVLCIQAKCETTSDPLGRAIGEYLWTEWFKIEDLKQAEALNDRTWHSLFQQRPRPIEGAFFHEEDLLVIVTDAQGDTVKGPDGRAIRRPCAVPTQVNYVFAVIDSAVKTGKAHDGLGVMFFARSRLKTTNPPLVVLDWDYTQIQGAFLNEWLPTVFTRLEQFAKDCKAFEGSKGAWIEDQVSGTILLQHASRRADWVTHPIESGLTMMGKKERAISVSGHVAAGKVKWTEQAYTRVVTYKGSTRNHALSQLLRVSMDSKDNDADDLLDCKTYGIAIALGNREGF